MSQICSSAPLLSVIKTLAMLLLPTATRIARCTVYTALRRSYHKRIVSRSASNATELKTSPPQHTGGTAKASPQEKTSDSNDVNDQKHKAKHIVLYEAGSKRLLRISSAAAVINGMFWSFYVGVLEAQIPSTTWEPWGYMGLGCTALMFGVSNTFAKHWVSNVSYFPEYRLLSIATHTFFGSERVPRLVKLGGIVAPPVKPTAIYVPFKVKGDFFYSLLDTDDGVFHDKTLLMNLLKATPGGDAAAQASTTSVQAQTTSTGKTKLRWKRRKRNR